MRVLLSLLVLTAAAPAIAAPLPAPLATLAKGLTARVVIAAGAPLANGYDFPANNDLTAYLPTGPDTGYLMVGHELLFGTDALGGRFTRLELKNKRLIGGQLWSSGMNLNCAGSVTPWHTLLSGEEFPHKAPVGPAAERRSRYETKRVAPSDPEAAFGWVYEIRPFGATPAGQAKRLTALGRFSHESAVVVGDRVVYLTEDDVDGYFYRFVADRPRDLSTGKLFAFDRKQQKWLPLKDPYNARMDAKAAGATPFNRLEDIQLAPDGALYFAETGNPEAKDPYGRVLRFEPMTQRLEVYVEGDGKRLANPDNLIFDRHGNLLVCEDQFGENLAKFGLNEVVRIDAEKRMAPVMSFNKGYEPSGPSWHADGSTLFVSALGGKKSMVLAIDGF